MNFSLQSNRGATGVLGRAKGGLEAFNQWESPAELTRVRGVTPQSEIARLGPSLFGRLGNADSMVLLPNFPPPQSRAVGLRIVCRRSDEWDSAHSGAAGFTLRI